MNNSSTGESTIVAVHLNNNKRLDAVQIDTSHANADSYIPIMSTIKGSKVPVVVNIVGTLYSAAIMLALSYDKVTKDIVSFNIHTIESNTDNSLFDKVFKDIYRVFLSTYEIERVLNGSEVWLSAGEVRVRWNKVKRIRGINTKVV